MSREKMILFLCRLRATNSARLFDALSIPPGVLFLLAKERGIGLHE